MVRIVFVFLFLLLAAHPAVEAQKPGMVEFSFEKGYAEKVSQPAFAGYEWKINGASSGLSQEKFQSITHFPAFDTILFRQQPPEPFDTIVTRFIPGREYLITLGCCNEGFDIFDRTLLENETPVDGAPEDLADSIELRDWDESFVRFRLRHGTATDSLMGMYYDFAGFPSARLLEQSYTEWMCPLKGYYATNINTVIVARPKKGIRYYANDELGCYTTWDEPGAEGMEILLKRRCRFFYGERIRVNIDAKTMEWKWKLETVVY